MRRGPLSESDLRNRDRIVGSTIADCRGKHALSVRDMGRLSKEVRASCKQNGLPAPVLGLSRNVVRQKESALKEQARSLVGNTEECLRFLLNEVSRSLVSDAVVFAVVLADGYSPTLRPNAARHRVALGIYGATIPTPRAITLSDKKKIVGESWWELNFLPSLRALSSSSLVVDGKAIRVIFRSFCADHGESWSHIHGCGGQGQRSTFCSANVTEDSLGLHSCQRLTLREMSASGFENKLSLCFHEASYTQPPALHDTKGIGILLLTRFGVPIPANMTGKQVREAVRQLERSDKPLVRLQALLFAAMVTFRYQNINIAFWRYRNARREKMWVFSLVAFHCFVMVMHRTHPGSLSGPGATYVHSMSHAFDEQSDVPMRLNDELFERENGIRKDLIASCSRHETEVDLMLLELKQRLAVVDEHDDGFKEPLLCSFDIINVCRLCLEHSSWESLQARVAHAKCSGILAAKEDVYEVSTTEHKEEYTMFHICVCSHLPRNQNIEPPAKKSHKDSDPAFVTLGYSSSSTRFRCVCKWTCGQEVVLERHKRDCAAWKASQSTLDTFVTKS